MSGRSDESDGTVAPIQHEKWGCDTLSCPNSV